MPSPFVPQIRLYRRWLREQRGLEFPDYESLWQWSVRDLDAFWQSIWDYFDMQSPTPHTAVLAARKMPGAVWFPGAQVNYARQVFRHVDGGACRGLAGHHQPQRAGRAARDVLARAAAPGRLAGAAPEGARASAAATASRPTCPTCPRPWSPSWRAPASAGCGASARPTWARPRCSTASARSSRRC